MYKREAFFTIKPFLKTRDILLLYGARQVGKTSIMKYIQENYLKEKSIFLDLEKEQNLLMLNGDPDIFIEYLKSYYSWKEGEKISIFIDEIQYLNNPTSFLKYIYDNYVGIKFITSGSSTLELRSKMKDSLVGRIIKFDIFPLSFKEFLVFKKKSNLAKLVGKKVSPETINDEIKVFFKEYIEFGGYPKISLTNNRAIKKHYLKQIYNTYIQKDIKDIGKINDIYKFNKLIVILAKQSGNLLNISGMASTIGVDVKTINNRLFLLENTFVIKLVKPFSKNVRGELIKMPKVFFMDNGIRNSICDDFEMGGSSLETSVFNAINNSYNYKDINFYRTKDKREIDFILDLKAFETKLSYNYKRISSLDYFEKNYGVRGSVITMNKQDKESRYSVFYPWEL